MVRAFTDTNVLGEVDPDVFVGSRIARRIRVSLGRAPVFAGNTSARAPTLRYVCEFLSFYVQSSRPRRGKRMVHKVDRRSAFV
jgi:hypothetical protein